MKTQKISTMLILVSLVLVSAFFSGRTFNTEAAINNPIPVITVKAENPSVNVTKTIYNPYEGLDVVNYETWLGNIDFNVTIRVTNTAAEDIYNVSLYSYEENLTQIGYNPDWLDISGNLTAEWAVIPSGEFRTINYTVSPLFEYTYTFTGSNVTYTWINGTTDYSLSNSITFIVYEQGESIRVEKFVSVGGVLSKDGRTKINNNFSIVIQITNFWLSEINLTINDQAPGNETEFNYTTSQLTNAHGFLDTNETYTYSYEVEPILLGEFVIPFCDVDYVTLDDLTPRQKSSNTVKLLVYEPIYEGDDWSKKIPMLSVEKYFLVYDDTTGNWTRKTEIFFYNTTIEKLIININITNSGIVEAYNIEITEGLYREWAFITEGNPESWELFNLTQGQSKIFQYNITAKINGVFYIEPTKITYSFQNQENLLIEEGYVLYSNMLYITIEGYVPEPPKTTQWWITISISLGIVLLGVIPLIITFVYYSKRRRTQKGM